MQEVKATIAGYRQLTAEEQAAMNANKQIEEQVLVLLDKLAADAAIDKRWLAIGRTHIEQGFMAVNRSIARPQRLTSPAQ